ncbi:MAG: exodeoxyribonuclease VII small subunit [Alphaproteobacteria bacterium]|nr:exodeoxyribonuclease VII small subunit [Alphaproteobacteria bacterium]
MEKKQTLKDISKMDFEEALSSLEEIVRRLESGNIKLDNAVDAYEKGMMLKKHCEDKLKTAKVRVDKISLSPNGDVELVPTEAD